MAGIFACLGLLAAIPGIWNLRTAMTRTVFYERGAVKRAWGKPAEAPYG